MYNSSDVEPLVRTIDIQFHIPTFDEIIKAGVAIVSESVGDELLTLLESEHAQYLKEDDRRKILELVNHEGFDKEAAKSIREILNSTYESDKYTVYRCVQ